MHFAIADSPPNYAAITMKVFISSVIRGFEPERNEAARAVLRHGWTPVMSENLPAQDRSPRAALLDQVAASDIYLLILGERYGGDEGTRSPTEDEYNEAIRLGKPIIVLIQQGIDREPAQVAFLERVTSGWGTGRVRGNFASPDGVSTEVLLALRELEKAASVHEAAPDAVERARSLATAGSRTQYGQRVAVEARLAVVPVGVADLISAVTLNADTLPGQLADAVRRAGLTDALAGFDQQVDASGVHLTERSSDFLSRRTGVSLDVNGGLLVEGPVAGSGQLGSMWIDPTRLVAFIDGATHLGPAAWRLLDGGPAVRQVAVQLAIPHAGNRSFGAPTANSVSLGGSGRLGTVLAPPEPRVVPVARLLDGTLTSELAAHVERAFRDVGAVNR